MYALDWPKSCPVCPGRIVSLEAPNIWQTRHCRSSFKTEINSRKWGQLYIWLNVKEKPHYLWDKMIITPCPIYATPQYDTIQYPQLPSTSPSTIATPTSTTAKPIHYTNFCLLRSFSVVFLSLFPCRFSSYDAWQKNRVNIMARE